MSKWAEKAISKRVGRGRTFIKLVRQLGKQNVRFHHLRHTHATKMLKLNVNAKIIQARLGHSYYQVTMNIYAHLMSDSQIGAIEA